MLRLLRQHGAAPCRARLPEARSGAAPFVGDRTIDTHVLNLRQKLERDPKAPRHLLTVHGVGYRLVEGPERQS
jgi:DNA-binding response OmpR family regulator